MVNDSNRFIYDYFHAKQYQQNEKLENNFYQYLVILIKRSIVLV